MNVETITMEPEQAQAKLEAYRSVLRRRADAEYEAIAQGYQAMADGLALIDLTEVIRAGGFDEKCRPRLAIARADRRQVRFSWENSWDTTVTFDARNNKRSSDTLRLSLDLDEKPPLPEGQRWYAPGFALVPLIPADVEWPVYRLKECFILWEVEAWSDRRLGSRPDRDPYLLQHLGGDLYAVLAAWDLTDLERAVMAGRRNG